MRSELTHALSPNPVLKAMVMDTITTNVSQAANGMNWCGSRAMNGSQVLVCQQALARLRLHIRAPPSTNRGHPKGPSNRTAGITNFLMARVITVTIAVIAAIVVTVTIVEIVAVVGRAMRVLAYAGGIVIDSERGGWQAMRVRVLREVKQR